MTQTREFNIAGPLPHGTTLIEASAGTGKTWTVAALVTRYVAEQGVPLNEILVVTFSRAASQELRERVRDMLEHALRSLESDCRPPEDALVAYLRDGSAEEVQQRRLRLRSALADFDTATIATIHQFCQYVLRGLGVAGDSDSFATLSEDLWQLRDDVISDVFLASQRDASFTLPLHEAKADATMALTNSTARIVPDPPPDHLAHRVTFARHVRREYRRRKKRAAIIEYDDLLSELATALHSADSAAKSRMRERWNVVLVDEFQDTDPVQWDVFATAFGEGGGALILIGDPKQAIYGFRGGDVQTYLQAAGTARERLSLPTNYRSDGPLVKALGVLLGDVQLSEGIVARRLSAARTGSRIGGTRENASELRYALGAPLPVGEARGIAARDAAAEIAQLLSGDGTFDGRLITPSDIAVLAARGADLISVREELRRLGVPAVLVTSESVLRTEAASWWLQLLMAMEQPHRADRVRAAALTPFIGWKAEGLDASGEEGTEDAARHVRRFASAFADGGIASVLDTARTSDLTARLLGAPGGERDLTDIEHCAQLLGEHALTKNNGLPSLVSWLRERSAEEARTTADARVMRLESDARAVTLSTIHGSKGLQYPIVLTPFLWSNWVKEDATPAIVHDDGGRSLCFDKQLVTRPEHRRETLDEDLRLAYVAMTRAQSRLVMWWIPTKRNTLPSGLHRLLFGQAETPTQLESFLEARAERHQRGMSETDAPVTLLPELKRLPEGDLIEPIFETWQRAGAFRAIPLDTRPDVPSPQLEISSAPLTVNTFDASTVIDSGWRRTSYSALVTAGEKSAPISEPETTDLARDDEVEIALPGVRDEETASTSETPLAQLSAMADLPMGATFGSLVHAALEEADFQATDLHREFVRQIAEHKVQWPVELQNDELARALVEVCETPLGDLAGQTRLCDIPLGDRMPEMEFELPLGGGEVPHAHSTLRAMASVLRRHLDPTDPLLPYADELESPGLGDQSLRGYLTGSIDLTFRHDGQYFVVDYKTNHLGEPEQDLTLGDYTPERLAAAMSHSSYPLQALLYAVVLHRYLRWRLPHYEPERHLGGVLYLYVRGMAGAQTPQIDGTPCGVFSWRPPSALVSELSDILDGAQVTEQGNS